MSATTHSDITLADMQALAELANEKLSPETPYEFALENKDWLTQLSRIRTDWLSKFAHDVESPIYRSPNALCSRLEIVGTNPCPADGEANGKLFLGDSINGETINNWVPLHKNISFLYSKTDLDFTGLSNLITADNPLVSGVDQDLRGYFGLFLTQTLYSTAWTDNPDWMGNPNYEWGTSTYESKPDGYLVTTNHTFTVTVPQSGIVRLFISIPADSPERVSGGFYRYTVVAYVNAGSNEVNFTATGYFPKYQLPRIKNDNVRVSAEYYWEDSVTISPETIIHTQGWGYSLAFNEIDVSKFSMVIDDVQKKIIPFVCISIPLANGVWRAKTIPAPATNVFIDQNLPNYVDDYAPSLHYVEYGRPAVNQYVFSATTEVATAGEKSGRSWMRYVDFFTVVNPRSKSRQPTFKNQVHPKPIAPIQPFYLEPGESKLFSIFVPDLQSTFGIGKYSPFFQCGEVKASDPNSVATVTKYASLFPNVSELQFDFSFSGKLSWDLLEENYGGTHSYFGAIFNGERGLADGRMLYIYMKNTHSYKIAVAHFFYEYNKVDYNPTNTNFTAPAVWPVIRDSADVKVPLNESFDHTRGFQFGSGSIEPAQKAVFIFTIRVLPNTKLLLRLINKTEGADYTFTVYDSATYPPNIGNSITFSAQQTVYRSDLESKINLWDGITLRCDVENISNTTGVFDIELLQDHSVNRRTAFFPYSRECYSYGLYGPTVPKLIPQNGFEIYSIYVRRRPRLHIPKIVNGKEKLVLVTDEEIEKNPELKRQGKWKQLDDNPDPLTITIGQYIGMYQEYNNINKGSFVPLTTVTIPAGEVDAKIEVSWPVVEGAFIVYSCIEQARVEVLAKFQPIFHTRQIGRAHV